MTKNVSVTWDLPTTRQSGLALDLTEIQHVLVAFRVIGAPEFTTLGQVLPTDPQAFAIADVDIGDWELRLVVVDTANRVSAPVDTAFNIPDESPPGVVVNVAITLS